LKKAFASGAQCALILEGEAAQTEIKLRVLDDSGETSTVGVESVFDSLSGLFDLEQFD